ncbi:barstar family protein [Bradyrhizobium sp. SSUT77]|uniref:barstar family protein n=1 Tax=Bradyrhizobium sp. SSUT77 TaxID=3040603 RepID=UPI00244CEFF9|nr:barstar family protein [Bradyrhizobium sp. SSUT77]MDH2342283.1 barstar family protein [Bradyrhizobium sp. SSUT77]
MVSLASGIEPPFLFRREDLSINAAVCAGLPADISNRMTLLGLIAQQLSFPDYFGENWDALEECLRDLSWLPAGPVVLEHADVPLVRDIANARIYIAILADATRDMSRSDRPLRVVFPPAYRDQISWLLRL